ncbi:scp family extracellular subfamily protein [Cystoisospora suis]|uniref:Scp family extracellular subfamily protein n=1 Tax=Cystoisospora suis TaxID=483139 RepID=A0A2C6K719_9APIC|nr:scp family extracellular subfamily protein [Cystoisospora suis]
MLSRHNELRQQYGIPPLKHDSSLQQFAEYWAHQLKKTHQCNLEHSTSTMHSAFTNAFSDLGENLWVGCVRGDPVWENAANDWFTEVYCYRYGKIGNRCTADKFENCDNSTHREGVMVGHFTQVMSDRSTHMGCASLLCDSLCQDKGPPRKKFLVVCNYGPGGNIIGVHPFKLEHAQRLNSLLKGTHVLPPAPEDPGSTKQCEARHRQFKVEKPKKNNL